MLRRMHEIWRSLTKTRDKRIGDVKPPQIRSIHVEAMRPIASSVNLTQTEIIASFLISSLSVTENMQAVHQQYCLSMTSAKQEKTVQDARDTV